MVDGRNGGGEASSLTSVNQPSPEGARSDDHALSSASKSPRSPNHPADMPPSKSSSKASSTRNSTPAAASSDLRQAAQSANGTPAASDQPLESQPMATTSSNSSHASAKEPKETPAAPYGTRSRNRPGTSRPNYAEDVEMDFEMAQGPTNGNTSEPPSRASLAAENGQPAPAAGKKAPGAGQGNAPWGSAGSNQKDSPANSNIPGTSAFAANPPPTAPQPTKRRKNAAGNATNGNHASPAAPTTQAAARRANNGNNNNAAVVPANSSRETNLMTFEKSRAMLKDGHLEADDGQKVSVNGKF